MLQGHGDDGYRYTTQIVADFSTNVWYGGEPAGLKEHLFSQWHTINTYPEVLAEGLGEQIARHHQVLPSQVLIYLLAQAFGSKRSTIVVPAFAEYEDACRMHRHQVEWLDWSQLDKLPSLQTDLLFICNPNNPTGYVFGQLEEWMHRNPDTLFVLDEAFIEFTLAISSAIPLLTRFRNLVILRSLTKAYAIPGLRLGYIVAAEEVIAQLKACKFPWSVNTLAIEAGKFIFTHFDKIQIPLPDLLAEKQTFVHQLRQLNHLTVYDSQTHFFVAQTHLATAAALKQFLIRNFRILIRDASNFRSLQAGHFRLATQTAEKNTLLLQALAEWKNFCS
jgi:threonine-phosphate decarboxylase